jgi:hypothetical protein
MGNLAGERTDLNLYKLKKIIFDQDAYPRSCPKAGRLINDRSVHFRQDNTLLPRFLGHGLTWITGVPKLHEDWSENQTYYFGTGKHANMKTSNWKAFLS